MMTPAQGNLMLDPLKRGATAADHMQVDQPPARVRRVYVAPKYCEPFTGECPLCLVEYVSGQVTCTTCGYEPLPVDESGEAKVQPTVLASWRSACKSLQVLGCTAR